MKDPFPKEWQALCRPTAQRTAESVLACRFDMSFIALAIMHKQISILKLRPSVMCFQKFEDEGERLVDCDTPPGSGCKHNLSS
jgi:hypothetical protein